MAVRGGIGGLQRRAMALADRVPDLRNPGGGSRRGLGLLPHVRVLPHFDKMIGRVPDVLTRPFFGTTDGVSLVGVDEDTALVGGPHDFTVYGRQSAWLLSDGRRQQYPAGTRMHLPSRPVSEPDQ